MSRLQGVKCDLCGEAFEGYNVTEENDVVEIQQYITGDSTLKTFHSCKECCPDQVYEELKSIEDDWRFLCFGEEPNKISKLFEKRTPYIDCQTTELEYQGVTQETVEFVENKVI